MVSTRPPTSKSSSPFNNPLVTVPNVPIAISIIVTFMFHSFIIIIIIIIIKHHKLGSQVELNFMLYFHFSELDVATYTLFRHLKEGT